MVLNIITIRHFLSSKVAIALALFSTPFCAWSAQDISLANEKMTVVLSPATGQVVSIADRTGARFLADSEDRYDLAGKLSTERADHVVSQTMVATTATFQCVNAALGLKISKTYRLNGNVLGKEIRYGDSDTEKQLFRVSSQSTVEPELFKSGYYYIPIDDGFKVYGVPFMPGPSIKEPTDWSISPGSFIYYFPNQNRVLTHYRYKINGGYLYAPPDPEIESKFVPGGAITALAEGFINNAATLTVESNYVIIEGDPRDYHQHIVAQPPYLEYRSHKPPAWFDNSIMFWGNEASPEKLLQDPEAIGREILNFLKLIPEDQNVMIFFEHWTVQGDFPYQGTFRYWSPQAQSYSDPQPIEKLKKNIKYLKSLSPRIKVGGYALLVPTEGTPPYEHKDWLIYDKDGKVVFAGDGTGRGGEADFSSGYSDYLLDQMRHYIADLGFDWIHFDCGIYEAVNWRTKNVVQSSEQAKFYNAVGKIFEAGNAAIVENVEPTVALWASGSYMEFTQPDRWEKKDWRVAGVTGYLAGLYRTIKPGAWINLVYGTRGIFGMRNAFGGLTGWIRGSLMWWRDISHSLAYEKVTHELLQTSLSPARVSPSWWKLETDKLEAETLQKGSSLIIPIVLHGDHASEETISLKSDEMKYNQGNYLVAFDLRLFESTPLDVFKPVPWKVDYMELLAFDVETSVGATYTHRLTLEPLRNYYHLVTQTPGWVYSVKGERPPFLLPETSGVKISGSAPINAVGYALEVENHNQEAQVLAYVPKNWPGVEVKINGQVATPRGMDILGQRCVLLDVGSGLSRVDLSKAESNFDKLAKVAYQNPFSYLWRESSQQLFYSQLEHRAYEEDGKSCLALKPTAPGETGTVDFIMDGKEKAGGVSLKVKGGSTGGKIVVAQSAGDVWKYEIKDDFNGWKEFNITREQMTADSTRKNWAETTLLSIINYPAAGKEISIADIHLLPARNGDISKEAEPLKRSLTIYKTKTPPVLDGYGHDPCWKNAQVATDFYKYANSEPPGSKTTVQGCYDDENLYLFFTNMEPIVNLPTVKRSKPEVFVSPHAHMFLDPYRDGVNYFEIAVDAAGNIADIRNNQTGADEKWNGVYEVKIGLNYGISWTVEMKIPFKTLGKTPKEGDVWGVTFARADNTSEVSVWTRGQWNNPHDFGELKFGGETK